LVSNYLDQHLETEYLLVSDSRIHGNKCQKYRPDKLYASPNRIIHIEVDEHQHLKGNYTNICEEKRILDIYSEFDNQKYVVIRFNPHKYNAPIAFAKITDINEKLKTLLNVFKYGQNVEFDTKILIIYVFYNSDNRLIVKNIRYVHMY